MKVLFPIGTIFPSQKGGPSNTVYWMAKALHTEGVEVVTVATNFGIEDKTIQFDTWIQNTFGRVRYTSDRLHQIPFKLIYFALKELKTADIVHLTSIFYPPSWIIATVALIKKKKIVWSPRGELDEQALIYSTWKKKPVLWAIKNFMLSKILFHTTSPEETNYTKFVFGNDINLIEIPNFLTIPEKEEKNTDEKYFLYIGRVHPKKAIENLIIALSESKAFLNSDCILKIAGDCNSDYGEMLKNLVMSLNLSEKVMFLGHIESKAKQILYANAYFTFMPSHTENFGNVVIESLAQGTPVVASKGTPWEILEKKEAGFWVNNSSESLSKIINHILSLDNLAYNSLKQNAESLASDYDISKNIKKWVDLYSKIFKNKKNG